MCRGDYMILKEMSPDERPRERLIEKGAPALSNAELLAIIMRTGTGSRNVLEIANELLQSVEYSLVRLSAESIEFMMEIKGVGLEKASTISAAFEIGRRFALEKARTDGQAITGAEMIYNMMIPILKGLDHEECWVIYLNRANYVIGKEKIGSGGMEAITFDNDAILLHALQKRARGIIMVHNHPSGNPRPGKADIEETETLRTALRKVRKNLVDHVIISDDKYFSFADSVVTPVPDVKKILG